MHIKIRTDDRQTTDYKYAVSIYAAPAGDDTLYHSPMDECNRLMSA